MATVEVSTRLVEVSPHDLEDQLPFAENHVCRWAEWDRTAPAFRGEELVAIGTKPAADD
jgi:hypothetical protein